jgi:hypothetical protein
MQQTKFYHQSNAFGCGMYSISNALLIDGFDTPLRLSDSAKGNRISQLNKWLHDDGFDYVLETLWLDSDTVDMLPEFVIEFVNANKKSLITHSKYIPICLEVYIKKDDKHPHMIACHLCQSGAVVLYDSLNKKPIRLNNIHELHEHYHIVYAIHKFVNHKNGMTLSCESIKPDFK